MASEELQDPIEYFLDELTFHGRSERTSEAYERVLREFEAHLAERGETPASADRRHCMEWIHALRDRVGESTVATYASYLHRFYDYMIEVDAFQSNPMTLVLAEMDETVDTDPARRDITVEAMRTFVSRIDHPLERAVVVTLLKTGIRVGELSNLDLRDCKLPELSTFGVAPRPQLDGRGRSLFVSSEPQAGETYNGERRRDSNKRQRDTVIPIDEECATVLRRWLAIRPDTESPAQPLFCETSSWGDRLDTDAARAIVRPHARAAGWYRTGGGPTENVTPHYFRHFFTTHLRDRTGDRGIVKYLRGDVASDVIDTYTHNWGDRVRQVYCSNIYQLFQ